MAGVVLYVDDDPASPALEPELERRGHRLVHTQDPEEVVDLVASGEPVLVFLEPLLSGCDGFALLHSIHSARPDLPVVVVTRGRNPRLYPRSLENGCRDFLTKPVLPSQLLACVYDLAGRAAETPVDTRQESTDASPGEPQLSGGAEGLGFAGLLRELHDGGFSGVVIASSGARRTGIELRNGTPITASSNAGRERLEDFLLRRGRIDQEQHDRLIDQLAGGVGRVEEILIASDVLSEEELRAARAEQGREVLLEAFGWLKASHRLLAGKRLKADTALPVECSASAVLLEGILERTPPELVRAWVDHSRGFYVSEGARWESDELPLSPEQRALVTSFHGDRSLAEIVAEGEVEPRVLCALALAGGLDLRDDTVLVLRDALAPIAPAPEAARPATCRTAPASEARLRAAPQPLPAREDPPRGPEPARASEAPPPAANPPRAPAPERPRRVTEARPRAPEGMLRERVRVANPILREGELERRVAELEALVAQLAERDVFGVLEVSEESSDEDVNRVYRAKLALDFLSPPPELAREPAITELVRKVRDRLAQAYRHLSTQDGRRVQAALRRSRSAEPAAAGRALDAEDWFRKGQALLRSRDYAKALEALGMATHLDPQQGEYLSHLGQALFLSNPRNDLVRREAMEHMARGIKLSPDVPLSYVFLGRALDATDDAVNAMRMFRRALKIDPEFRPALQEMRLLAKRAKDKNAGLLGRLRRS